MAKRNLAGGLSVTDEEAKAAVRYAFEELKLVVEPGGAVSLAAILARQARPAGQDRRGRAVGRQHRPLAVRRDHPGPAPGCMTAA